MTKITSNFSEDIPIKYTLKGLPLVNTDKWKIGDVITNNNDIKTNIVDDKSFNIIPTAKEAKACKVTATINYIDMPISKDDTTVEFEWAGTYVAPTLPDIEFVGDCIVDNGSYTYSINIKNAAVCNYPITCNWSVEKAASSLSTTSASATGSMSGNSFIVNYENITDIDGPTETMFIIKLNVTPAYNNEKIIYTKEFYVHNIYDSPVITSSSNPNLMKLMYDLGWSMNEGAMFHYDCRLVDDNAFKKLDASKIISYEIVTFNELRYFSSITKIPATCFMINDGKYIKSIALPQNITSIEGGAFQGCYGLRTLDLSLCDSLMNIGSNAFYYCMNLTTVILSNTKVVNIGSMAFNMCTSLSVINFPTTLETIGDAAFLQCPVLQYNFLDTKLRTVGAEAFKDESGTSGITMTMLFPETLLTLDNESLANKYIADISFKSNIAPTTTSSTFKTSKGTIIGSAVSGNKNLYYPSSSEGYDGSNWSVFSAENGWSITNA